MEAQELVDMLKKKMCDNAYTARSCETLKALNFLACFMTRVRDIHFGKACGYADALHDITGDFYDDLRERAISRAARDAAEAGGDIAKILGFAGFDGDAYRNEIKEWREDYSKGEAEA